MSFETFQQIFHKMPRNLTQIAFGIGDIDGNPNHCDYYSDCRCVLQWIFEGQSMDLQDRTFCEVEPNTLFALHSRRCSNPLKDRAGCSTDIKNAIEKK